MKKFFISILKNIRMLLPFLAGVFLLVSLSRQFLPENLTLKILQSSEYFQVITNEYIILFLIVIIGYLLNSKVKIPHP